MLDARNLKKPLVILLTIPAGIALSVGALPLLLVALERLAFPEASLWLLREITPDSARALLGAVAGAAMSALALSYSLMLIVFTLAAGNIGPRLLTRFTSDPVAQVTAGLLGGTFLYALVTLAFVRDGSMPFLATAGAAFLAVISVLQLIYFVRNVAGSVSIDDEVAKISKSLLDDLEKRPDLEEAEDTDDAEFPEDARDVLSIRSGYVGAIDRDGLLEWATRRDCIVRVARRQGLFVVAGEPVASVSPSTDEDGAEKIRLMIRLTDTRKDDGSLDFPLNLLVEIALRALSPGVNDTFTALAAVDSLTHILVRLDGKRLGGSGIRDDAGNLRVLQPGLNLSELAGQALHPLRRAARENIMMYQAIARAITRLDAVGSKRMQRIVAKHRDLLLEQLDGEQVTEADKESVRELLPA